MYILYNYKVCCFQSRVEKCFGDEQVYNWGTKTIEVMFMPVVLLLPWLTSTGTIPKWLNGSLYRNGPGIYQIGETCLEHLLDGFSVLHRYIIHDGEVQYQSHVLESEAWTSSGKANRLVVSQFATYASPDPCKSFLSKWEFSLLFNDPLYFDKCCCI